MPEMLERTVRKMALRVGLEVISSADTPTSALSQLIEPESGVPVFPAGNTGGACLSELEDWLQFPWE
jgi:hypothetical protein